MDSQQVTTSQARGYLAQWLTWSQVAQMPPPPLTPKAIVKEKALELLRHPDDCRTLKVLVPTMGHTPGPKGLVGLQHPKENPNPKDIAISW